MSEHHIHWRQGGLQPDVALRCHVVGPSRTRTFSEVQCWGDWVSGLLRGPDGDNPRVDAESY